MHQNNKLQKTGIAGVILFGLSTFITASLLTASILPFNAMAVNVGEEITAITYNFDQTPANITFDSTNISSPNTNYDTYFVNPLTSGNAIVAHDGRFSGGFQVTIQADNFVKTGSPGTTIPANNLSIVTSNNTFTDTIKTGTPAVTAPLDGNPASQSADYSLPGHSFTGALVIIDGTTADCVQGRVGTYTTYPSYRLHIPNTTQSGQYTGTLTYTIVPAPGNC